MNTDQNPHDGPDHADAAAQHETDDHGHTEDPLGPIDVKAWGAGALGVVIGLAVVACFVQATSALGG